MSDYEKTVQFWRNANINSVADLERVLSSFRILFAYHSGKIENDEIDYHDTREIFENGRVVSFTGEPRSLFEQQNQKLCYEYLVPRIFAKEPLSLALIKEVHGILTAGTYDERRFIENDERPGAFKKHDYVTGLNEVGAPAHLVERELSELLEEINGYDGINTIRVAAYFHAQFEFIHPFADGNGRVGRTLLNYFLMIRNHPPLIIYEQDRKLYYECLEKYDEAEEIEALMKFLMYETEKTWAKTLEKQTE